MHVLARLRRRRRVPYWLTATAVALLTALAVGRLSSAAATERARWGSTRTAVVVTSPVAAGTRLDGHVSTRELPVALVPRQAVRTLPAGAAAAVDLAPGEVLLESRLAGRSTVAARLPAGTRGIAVPTANGLPIELGDQVDLLATFDTGDTGSEPTIAVARDARVVGVGKESVTVAVSIAAAPRVAYALAVGTVTLTLSG